MYLGFGLTRVDEINSGTTIRVVGRTQPIPCRLMLWWLYEPEHQQALYWPPKPEYSVSSLGRVNRLRLTQNGRHFTGNTFECISMEKWLSIKFSVNFVLRMQLPQLPEWVTSHYLNQWWTILLTSASLGLSELTFHFDWLMQERHNSIANALELHLSCTNPSR